MQIQSNENANEVQKNATISRATSHISHDDFVSAWLFIYDFRVQPAKNHSFNVDLTLEMFEHKFIRFIAVDTL